MTQIQDDLSAAGLANIELSEVDLSMEAFHRFKANYPRLFNHSSIRPADLTKAREADSYPIPHSLQRELYFGEDHTAYWLSGLLDALKVKSHLSAHQQKAPKIFELGCASGRVLRHLLHIFADSQILGADLKRSNVQWLRTFLKSPQLTTLFNSSLPCLPLESNSFDVAMAFSVFTHIDENEEEWLWELKRILKPGGILYLTVITDRVWHELGPDKLLSANYLASNQKDVFDFTKPMPAEKVIWTYPGNEQQPYLKTVLHKRTYIERNWFPAFPEAVWKSDGHDFHDVIVFKK